MRKIHVHADYDLKVIRDNIAGREKLGLNTAGEKELYRAWIKYPDYALADNRNIKNGVYKFLKEEKHERD